MRRPLPFRHIEPFFCAGLFDDPLLLVHIKPLGRSCLFDCGQVHHLAKRMVKRTTSLFISHAHMDHFMGVDSFIRHNHVSPATFDIFGPPGITEKMAHKLAAYDWNLTEPSWCSLRVHDVFPERLATALFPGPDGFPCRQAGDAVRTDPVVYRNEWIEVAAASCDHRIPSLIYRITERPRFVIDQTRMAELGLVPGDWLRLLKKRILGGGAGGPLAAQRRRDEGVEEWTVTEPEILYDRIRLEESPAAVGYIGDIGAGSENLAQVDSLLAGVTLLVCSCSFLAKDRDKARHSCHLCTSDLNLLVDRIRPRFLLPMHLSKSYQGRSALLYDELELPPGVTLLRLPPHLTPRPLFTRDMVRLDRPEEGM